MKSNKYTIYFGRDIVNNRAVADTGINYFLQEIVSPIFPSFPYQDAIGYWKGAAERSFILTIITDDNQVDDIRKIINWYKDEFNQDAVGLEISTVEFDLV